MADFRGVSKEAVIDSFVRAGLFLRQQKLGQHTDEVIDSWDKNGATTKIGAARDDKQLANAIKQNGLTANLSYYQDMFMYHAAAERADGTETQMQDLYRDLMAWSAFFDASAAPNSDVGKEVRTHIVVDLLDRINVAGIEAEACYEKLAVAVGELEKKDKQLADWLDAALPVTQLLHSTAEPQEFRRWLAGASPSQDGCLQRTLYGISNLPPEETVNAVPKAMERYSVALSNQLGPAVVMPASKFTPIQNKFRLALAPFVELAQTAKINIRPLTKDQDKWSVSFYGTRGAAQTVALHLKKFDLSILDSEGRVVEPPPQKLLPAPPPPSPPG